MKTTQKDLSYFEIRLQEHINNSFPELWGDHKFISRRSDLAANAYEGAFLSGNSIEQCDEIADFILFEDLHFSKFDTVFEVVCREFDTLMADEALRSFALQMFPVCRPVFKAYELTDDFAYTIEYNALYTELTGSIQIWIEEHGLQ
ncbi:DUF1896 domain-containing protein [Pedobacter sp. ISL-68]|uniref:DUF1896 domain-containing protein n=1 Tax=unclassified Pedobacter TaxID=2628915 RepID=UPI001BE6843D|nr:MULTISPECIES: DUF1896 domain-containing protein [unclassified Pedobacter]MBT2559796.1 DUF1896 domain-containing protein [Pedobacter sp. ISL-64]MBT2592101.1 DUF1896 domain-containing protein [Pedobacter sp. ISL-68]